MARPSRTSRTTPSHAPVHHPVYQIRFAAGAPTDLLARQTTRFRLYPGSDLTYFVSHLSLTGLKEIDAHFECMREIAFSTSGVTIVFPHETVLHDVPTDAVVEEMIAFALSRKARGKTFKPLYCGRTREDIPDSFVLDIPGGIRNYRWKWEERKTTRRAIPFRDRFPKLIKRMTDPATRFVVSLGGGGLLLFAHPSIFKLIEAMGAKDHIEEIWGGSGGAIAGMAYSLGADHQIIEQEGYDIYNRKYNLEFRPSSFDMIKNLVLSRLLPGSSLNIKGFVDIHNAMQESLARICKQKKPLIPFYALAYNMTTNTNEVLTPSPVRRDVYKGFIRHCSPIDSVLASAAIPILFVPRVIRRGATSFTYIDGSIFEEVPTSSVYHKWIIDRKHHLTRKKKLFILSVNLFPYLSTQKYFGDILLQHLPILELVTVLLRLADLMRRVRIDDSIKAINADPRATVVEVRLPKLSTYNFLNPQIIPTVIERARGTFYQQLLRIEQNL